MNGKMRPELRAENPVNILLGKRWGLLLAVWLTLGCGQGWAEEAKPRQAIAVLELEGVGTSEIESLVLTQGLSEALLDTGLFKLADGAGMPPAMEAPNGNHAGCTGQQCVVLAGRQLGADKVVAGKAVKMEEGLWLLSAVMLDAETAATLALESVRHRGDFATLLDSGIPTLAKALAGGGGNGRNPAEAPMSSAAPRSSRRSSARAYQKASLAVFPTRFEGKFAHRVRAGHASVIRRVEKVVGVYSGWLSLSHSFYPTTDPSQAHTLIRENPAYLELEEMAWRGRYGVSPNDRYVFSMGKILGVDLVLLHYLKMDRDSGFTVREYRVFLYDVNHLRVFHRAGKWSRGKGSAVLDQAYLILLEEFQKGRPESDQ